MIRGAEQEADMTTSANPQAVTAGQQPETEAERSARVARERVLLEEGFEDARLGRVLSGAALDAWLDRFARGLPPMKEKRGGR